MQKLVTTLLLGQYEAALSMLRDTIVACPAEHWETRLVRWTTRFVAFHTLYCTDMYLSRSEAEVESHELLLEGRGLPFGEPFPKGKLPPGLTQPRTLEYAAFCIAKARAVIPNENEADLSAASGFNRRLSRAEMHIYNIRHIQHHAGALAAHVRRLTPAIGEDAMGWIDTGTQRINGDGG